jgi:glycerol-3-phosphate dehydrogenase
VWPTETLVVAVVAVTESATAYGSPMAGRHHDVVIIGGGVVGCAIAHELGRHDVDAVLLEREAEVGFGTSKANSGIIHGGHHASPDTLKGQLEWAGNQMWGDLCAELGFGFARVGELTVALEEDQLPAIEKLLANAEAKGIPGVERWNRGQTLAAEPKLNPDLVAALHAPMTAVINPYEACFGLAAKAAACGVGIRTDCQVTSLDARSGGWEVKTTEGVVGADFVVNAAGLYAGAVAAMAGVQGIDIVYRKGEEYMLDKRRRGLVSRVIYPCPTPTTKGTLVIPTYDGTIMVGPTADEVGDPEDRDTTADGARRVLDGARRLVPGISERDVIAQFAGSRAVLASEDFVIRPDGPPGFIDVAGIQSPGLTAAPAIAVMVAGLLRDEGLALEPARDPTPLPRQVHFDAMTASEQDALAAADPRYRRMTCRCEFVTEGEVLDAIDAGARTLDGIKFRTRAGMGRCQGGFCTPRCMELLAGASGVPLSEVTKRGGGSWLVLERGDRGEV